MVKQYKIRLAKYQDAKEIHKVILSAFEEYRHYYTPEGFADTVLSEEATIDRMKEMSIYVAVDQEGLIVGTIGWQKVNINEGHIRGMGVIPKKQGKNSPAAILLKTVEDDARSKGCNILTLDTTKVLKRAQNFYKKHGFKETGKTGDFFGCTIYEYAKNILQCR